MILPLATVSELLPADDDVEAEAGAEADSSESPLLLPDDDEGDEGATAIDRPSIAKFAYDNSTGSSSDLGGCLATSSSCSSSSTSSSDEEDVHRPALDYQSQVNDDEMPANDEGTVADEQDELSVDPTLTSLSPASIVVPVVIESQRVDNEILAGASKTTATAQHPVGFESTMDDVSDTELESYLLELELESGNPVVDGEPTDEPLLASNADSFSQASTVEFGPHEEPEESMQEKKELQLESVQITSAANTIDQHQATEMAMQTKPKKDSTKKKTTKKKNDGLATPIVASVSAADLTPTEQAPAPPVDWAASSQHLEEPTPSLAVASVPAAAAVEQGEVDEPTVGQLSSASSSEEFETPVQTEPSTMPEAANPTLGGANQPSGVAAQLGTIPPYWIPDAEANACMRCQLRFSLIKRRHHCRCCGLVLCSGCCSLKAKLAYMGGSLEARVCVECDEQLQDQEHEIGQEAAAATTSATAPTHRPNPNNPMEYCSQISPLLQTTGAATTARSPTTVMVPVGVLKRQGSSAKVTGPGGIVRPPKTVIFSDGIRPGCDLTDLDNNWDRTAATRAASNPSVVISSSAPSTSVTPTNRSTASSDTSMTATSGGASTPAATKAKVVRPPLDRATQSYIGADLPPICESLGPVGCRYLDVTNDTALMQRLQTETLRFALQRNLYVLVRIVTRE